MLGLSAKDEFLLTVGLVVALGLAMGSFGFGYALGREHGKAQAGIEGMAALVEMGGGCLEVSK